jgi:type I restriction enzyme S subunit
MPQHTFQDLINAGVLEIGDGYRAKHSELGGDGPIFFRAGGLTDEEFDFSEAEHFRSELWPIVRGKMALAGDTVVTTKGNSTGRTGYVSEGLPPFVYSPHLSYWRSKRPDQLRPEFLRYWARGPEFRDQLEGMKTSTDMAPYLSLTDQRRLRITLPSPSIQRAIAATLMALDDKIVLNRKINRALEDLASMLFKSWFVDFDPVIAKRDGKTPVGVPADALEFFPSHFQDTELGPIPKGWRVAHVEDAFDVNPKRDLSPGVVAPYLQMANVPTVGHSPDTWIMREAGSGMRFTNGDTLIARITPCLENGKTAFVDFLASGEVGWGSTEFLVVRSKPPLPLVASYLLARDDSLRAYAVQRMTGSSGRQRVAADVLGRYALAMPDHKVATVFGDIVEPLFEMARRNSVESKILRDTRDVLLAPLLSGEVTIKAAETTVAEVV